MPMWPAPGGDLMRVLVADDERLLAETVAEGLRRLSIAVDVCYDGEAALELLSVHRYDVAVLDRDMPGRTGDEVCRHVVARRDGVRVLMLTAAGGIRDRVDGLGLGADARPVAATSRPSASTTYGTWSRMSSRYP
jgi:DNA-binding response OmpR family regulator